MSYSQTLEAIVLQCYNVGEADRFVILFTRERGRLAARARAVRKLKSKMGGSLLPLSHTEVELKESSTGFLITSARRLGEDSGHLGIPGFLAAMRGMEWLLTLLHDEEPLPEIFDLTVKFLSFCKEDTYNVALPRRPAPSETLVLGFSLRLLQHLGQLPTDTRERFFAHFNENERSFIEKSTQERWYDLPVLSRTEHNRLTNLTLKVAEENAVRAPKVVSRW